MIVILIFFKAPERSTQAYSLSEKFSKFDPIGTIFFIPAVICLILALQYGGTKYSWKDARVIGLLVIFGLLSVIFIVIQAWKKDNATLPFRIIRQRSVAASIIFGVCIGGAFFMVIFYVSGAANISMFLSLTGPSNSYQSGSKLFRVFRQQLQAFGICRFC
jgi:hypothetical protein